MPDTAHVSIPADVAERFTDTWCGALTGDVAAALNCAEVEVLADLLCALGAHQAASEWIDAHAEDDTPGDDHYGEPVPDEVSLVVDGYRWSPELASPTT